MARRYEEEFKRQAVELVIHSGKTQAQIARELGVSEYSLTLWRRDYLGQVKPAQLDGEQLSSEQMLDKIRQLQKENDYLKRQREIGFLPGDKGQIFGCPDISAKLETLVQSQRSPFKS
jgi:transposase